MPPARIADSITAEVRPARKIDRIRNIWGDIQTLRAARLTYKQIVAQLPKFGIDGISYSEFRHICYRIRKDPLVAGDVSVTTPLRTTTAVDFDPLADARRRRDEKTRPIFQQRKEG